VNIVYYSIAEGKNAKFYEEIFCESFVVLKKGSTFASPFEKGVFFESIWGCTRVAKWGRL
jgi:hypothetical protein